VGPPRFDELTSSTARAVLAQLEVGSEVVTARAAASAAMASMVATLTVVGRFDGTSSP
jgi:hypothetical protein